MLKRANGTPEGEAGDAGRRRRKATMKDVADLAGVSLATVSRALSASAEVSPRLSRRVQAAASRLNYAVNINARGLRGKTSGLVVVLLPDIANPFFSVLLQGIEEQARSHEMSVLIGDTGVDHAIAETYWRLMQGQRADGIILLNGFLPVQAGAARERLSDRRRQRAHRRRRCAVRRHRQCRRRVRRRQLSRPPWPSSRRPHLRPGRQCADCRSAAPAI